MLLYSIRISIHKSKKPLQYPYGVFPREGYISILFPREGYILRLFPREGYISILFPREGHDFWRQINCMYLKEHVLSVVVCGGEQPHTG